MTYQAQLMDAVVNSMAEGLAVVDDSGRWLLRNPAATRVGGLAGDLRALLATARRVGRPARPRAGRRDRARHGDAASPTRPGAGRILAVSAAPLPRDSVTGRARALLIFRDATVEHARRVDLTAFAEVVAHDLRNPLAAVESWTEMMALELGDGDARARPGARVRRPGRHRRPPDEGAHRGPARPGHPRLDAPAAPRRRRRRWPRRWPPTTAPTATSRSATSPTCTPTPRWSGRSSTTCSPTP